MKKIIGFVSFLSISTVATPISSVVTLNGGGDVAAETNLSVNLTGLVAKGNYNVVCYITSQFPFQYVLLGSNLSDNTSSISSYSINGKNVSQDQLKIGQNLVVINGTFTSPTTSSVVFTNLDKTNPFNVNNCFAIPV